METPLAHKASTGKPADTIRPATTGHSDAEMPTAILQESGGRRQGRSSTPRRALATTSSAAEDGAGAGVHGASETTIPVGGPKTRSRAARVPDAFLSGLRAKVRGPAGEARGLRGHLPWVRDGRFGEGI